MKRKDISDLMIAKAVKQYHEDYDRVRNNPKYEPLDRKNYRDRGNKLIMEYMKDQATVLRPHDLLHQWTDAHHKIIYAAIERAFDNDIVENNTNYPSLTEKGLQLLKDNDGK